MTETLDKFVALKMERYRREDELEVLTRELRQAEMDLIDEMVEEGVIKLKLDNGVSISVGSATYASVVTLPGETDDEAHDRVGRIFEELGRAGVKRRVHSATISAFVREKDKANEPLPPDLEERLKISRVDTINARALRNLPS